MGLPQGDKTPGSSLISLAPFWRPHTGSRAWHRVGAQYVHVEGVQDSMPCPVDLVRHSLEIFPGAGDQELGGGGGGLSSAPQPEGQHPPSHSPGRWRGLLHVAGLQSSGQRVYPYSPRQSYYPSTLKAGPLRKPHQ